MSRAIDARGNSPRSLLALACDDPGAMINAGDVGFSTGLSRVAMSRLMGARAQGRLALPPGPAPDYILG